MTDSIEHALGRSFRSSTSGGLLRSSSSPPATDQFVTGPIEPIVRSVGQGGVDIFFVISGYVMTYTTAVHGYDRSTFLIRRLKRVVPLYWTLTIFTAVLLATMSGFASDSRFSWSDLVASFLFIPHYNAGDPAFIGPTLKLGWTLNYEMFFYIWFAALIYLSALRRTIALTVAFSLIVLLAQAFHPASAPLKFWGEPVVLEFLFGCAIGCADLTPTIRRVPRFAWVMLLAAAVITFAVGGAINADLAARVIYRGIPGERLYSRRLASKEHQAGAFAKSRISALSRGCLYSILPRPSVRHHWAQIVWSRLGLPHQTEGSALCFAIIAIAAGMAAGCAVYASVEIPLNRALKARQRSVAAAAA